MFEEREIGRNEAHLRAKDYPYLNNLLDELTLAELVEAIYYDAFGVDICGQCMSADNACALIEHAVKAIIDNPMEDWAEYARTWLEDLPPL